MFPRFLTPKPSVFALACVRCLQSPVELSYKSMRSTGLIYTPPPFPPSRGPKPKAKRVNTYSGKTIIRFFVHVTPEMNGLKISRSFSNHLYQVSHEFRPGLRPLQPAATCSDPSAITRDRRSRIVEKRLFGMRNKKQLGAQSLVHNLDVSYPTCKEIKSKKNGWNR